jgi:glycosyltransferase involved in cell wall biosynthesis
MFEALQPIDRQREGRLAKPLQVAKQSWPDGVVPTVTVFCITYNHGKFVEQALQGFLSQETTFPVEIFIHDDASTDNTAEIIKRFMRDYPSVVRAHFLEENQWSKGRKGFADHLPRQKGKFIALCEGDDYWRHPGKLQTQVEFLESNPGYVMSGHDCAVVDDEGNIVSQSLVPEDSRRDIPGSSLVRGVGWIPTASRVYRNVLPSFPKEIHHVMHGDLWICSLLGWRGDYKFFANSAWSCYRQHEGGVWSEKSKEIKQAEWCNSIYWLYRYYKSIGEKAASDHFLGQLSHWSLGLADTTKLLKSSASRIFSPLTWQGAWKKIVARLR